VITEIDGNPAIDPGLQAVIDEVLALPPGQLANRLAELVPELAGDGIHILPTVARIMSDEVDRSSGAGGSSSGDEERTDKFAWMKVFGTQADQDESDQVPGYVADIDGLILGIDDQISTDIRAGWAIGYAHTNADGKAALDGNSLDIDTYQLGLYAKKELDQNAYLKGQIQFAWNQHDEERDITGFGTAKGSYDSWYTLLNIAVGKKYDISKTLILTPEFSINYVYLDEDGYTEHGSPAALRVSDRNEDSLIFMASSQIKFKIEQNTSLIAHLGLGYDALASQAKISSTFVGGGPTFRTPGQHAGSTLLTVGFGLNMREDQALNMSVNYDATIREQYVDQGISATVRYRW
jgi:outer membrane autotransporter protein